MTLAFFDTNIFVYATDTSAKGRRARALVREGGRISVQTLNEFAHVARRKLKLPWPEVRELIDEMRSRHAPVVAVDEDLHSHGLRLAERYRLSIYDAMIVAAALTAECDVLYSEDMHAGLVVDGRLTIVNPFA